MSYITQANTRLALAYVWNDKGGRAFAFEDQDYWYRAWKPTVQKTAENGIKLHAKIDHSIEFHKDDHAVISLEFNSKGDLIGGDESFIFSDSGIDNFLESITDFAVDSAPTPKSKAAAMLAKATADVISKISQAGADAGRLVFPEVVAGVMEHYSKQVIASLEKDRIFFNFTVSEDAPKPGEAHRASENFQELNNEELDGIRLATLGTNKFGWNPDIVFDIMEDKFGFDDCIAHDVQSGDLINGLKAGKKYYIANPHSVSRHPKGHKFYAVFYRIPQDSDES